jgi:hypothetical protein
MKPAEFYQFCKEQGYQATIFDDQLIILAPLGDEDLDLAETLNDDFYLDLKQYVIDRMYQEAAARRDERVYQSYKDEEMAG